MGRKRFQAARTVPSRPPASPRPVRARLAAFLLTAALAAPGCGVVPSVPPALPVRPDSARASGTATPADAPAQVQSPTAAGSVAPEVAARVSAEVAPDAARLDLRPRGPVRADVPDSDAFLRAASVPSRGAPDADVRAAALLARMTIDEKVGQMTQVTLEVIADRSSRPYLVDRAALRRAVGEFHVGSVLNVVDEAYSVGEWRAITDVIDSLSRASRLGIPVLYGIDAVHGANYTAGAALMPQNLGLAATFNPALVQAAAAVTARDVRASGISWDFAPVLDIGRHVAWSRFYETFGEDPHLATVMGVAQVRGLEGTDLTAPTSVAATAKHFLGYSGPRTGRDRSSTFLTERELRDLYLPPYQAAIDAGVHTVMVSSGDVNGVPVHASRALLTDLLRGELGFEGIAVSDWEDIKKLATLHRVARDEREATRIAVMAGIDLSMVPNDFSFAEHLRDLVRTGEVPVARIDEAVGRILRVKARLGLLDAPAVQGTDPAVVGDAESRAVALQAARESITLLRNGVVDGAPLLPLAPGARVFVTGPAATSMQALNNGWTYTWQGDGRASVFTPPGRTVLDGLRALAAEVTYAPGATFDAPLDLAAAAAGARAADVAVVVLGESSYAEVPGSLADLWLPRAQLDLLDAVAATGTPVVLVLAEGRPRVLGDHAAGADAILMAYNPGNEGAQAIAEVLFGRVNPSGRLPFTYPSGPNLLVPYDRTLSDDVDTSYGFTGFRPLARFGDGLSYTTFSTTDLVVAPEARAAAFPVAVSVTIQNTGAVAGSEVVQVYVSDAVASVAPPAERLVRFAKIHLAPGERRTLAFALDARALSFVDERGRRVAEPGRFTIRVAGQTAPFDLVGDVPLVLSAP